MLDGLSKIGLLLDTVKKQGQKAVAITDHGNVYGVIAFYNECRKRELKPIIGVEAYVAQGSRLDKQTKMGSDQQHLTLLAKNFAGYQNILKLVTIAHLEGFSYKPRIDDEVLAAHSEGLIVLSGCMGSRFNRQLAEGKQAAAKATLQKYAEMFPGRFYVELQSHPGLADEDLTTQQVALARELNLPLVATNDVHYVMPDDSEAQDALVCVQTRKLISDTNRMSMLGTPDLYLKSTSEMIDAFRDYPEAIANTVKIADECDLTIPTGKLIFPTFPIPEGQTEAEFLEELTLKGLSERFEEITPEMEQRIKYELDVINQKGYGTYFLITQDMVNWAKQQGIGVGPGRGSAAGSLVSYCLRITEMNPLQHNLPFERFLNPQRPTPPDIDMDFADDRREEVIQYVAEKYGHDHVAAVITFGRMEARVAIRDIGRVLGMPYEEPDRIAKLIPNIPGKKTSLKAVLESVPEIAEYYKQAKYRKLIDLASKVEGSVRHSSVHAAALIIADKPLSEYTALQRDPKSGKMITQFDMYSLDCNVDDNAIGLLKFDFLGLRNLSTIQTALLLIKATKNVDIDITKIPLDDKKTFELLASGETMGVFQLESAGMRRVARTLKPNQFSDITAMVALYRPGPMDLIPQFIEGKHNPEKVIYPHPSLIPILSETYGVMVYQEQILLIANVMAGYSLGEADILRRAIGKKKKYLLDKNKKTFVDQSIEKGYTKEVANQVWGFIEAFANYGFNKAHAASYAMIAYQTAFLKANYPVEYMAALMSIESASHGANRDEKVAYAIETAKRMGIKILPPHINFSSDSFTIENVEGSLEGLAIRFGLSAIKNVGTTAIASILSTRQEVGPFASLSHFLAKTDSRTVNKKVLESLIKVGAMDLFGTRASMLENLEEIRNRVVQFDSGVDGQDHLFAAVEVAPTVIADTFVKLPEYPMQELLSFEKELLGMYLTDHPMGNALRQVAQRATKEVAELDASIHTNQIFTFGGVITKFRAVTTKTGKPMAFGTLEDPTGAIEFVVFPRLFEEVADKLQQDVVVLLKAKVDNRDEQLQLIAEKITFSDDSLLSIIPDEAQHEIFIPRHTEQSTLQSLGTLLKAHPGTDRIIVLIPNGGQPKKILLPYGVEWSEDLEKSVQSLLT
jgi:DNA polymerase III subunit alpha